MPSFPLPDGRAENLAGSFTTSCDAAGLGKAEMALDSMHLRGLVLDTGEWYPAWQTNIAIENSH